MREKLPVITVLAASGVAVILGFWLLFSMGRSTDSELQRTATAAPESGRSVRVEERLQMLRESYARQQQRDATSQPNAPSATPEHREGTRVHAGWHAHDARVKVVAVPVVPPPAVHAPPAAYGPPRTLTGSTIPMNMSFSRKPEYLYKNPNTDDLQETILHGTDRQGRMEALDQLVLKEPEDALRVLNAALQEENLDPEVYVGVIDALGDYVDDVSPELIAPALRHQNANVRFEAVSLLGDMDSPAARTALQGATNDQDPEVGELAKGILEFNH